MGTWDEGLLDNDAAMDSLGDLSDSVLQDVLKLGSAAPGSLGTQTLAAAVGVLLQLSSWPFSSKSGHAPKIFGAIRAHESGFGSLPAEAAAVLRGIAEGRAEEIAQRDGSMPEESRRLLNVHSKRTSPFGHREPSLFTGDPARAYVQQVADRCVTSVNEDFEIEDNWSDLCREASSMGSLGALLVLEPCRVPVATIQAWRTAAATGLQRLEDEEDEELGFHRGYYRNLDGFLALLEERFR
jgi:hypothetical protein